ncbi:bifunctional serine/threonine-protein kinase/formylglycine-generating enzyme family protein [Arenimonas composti]|uniref:Protein kinase domain-containing protein n=1 Tax=Arenimonas composti TR7-09 = DSM 18010 TaxID=1121013 RepID=A0A091BAG2_9GAMM|nr:bifunctional serine/threonine-protein kinase/formylglycine-generating enzyme family protein [Arenimonas composti]KFN49663.1 hypothetical protein P873_09860 [Arenimonas composti TR7-09 = DSM 18010]
MQQEEELSPEELSALLSSFMPEIPGYRVLRRIGKGGMSQVYLGVQESLDRQVAVKVMSPEALTDEISKQRFEHEARTIAKLEHPCIVGIHEVGRTRQGLLYYVLPYLAKGHLGQRDFTHDESRVVEVLRSLLSALEYAHARGIVHRDVKAENVLFDNADRPLLTDFGIALSKRDTTRITTAGLAVGSGGYMAPEQARGEVVDGRADLYSVGVLAYELLMGKLPYQAADPLALALMHAQDPVPRLPPEKRHWQPFIDRAMAKSPDNRYRNAQQMLGALNQIAEAGPPAEPVVDLGKAQGWLRARWKPAVSILSGLAIAAMVLVWWAGREHGPDFLDPGRDGSAARPSTPPPRPAPPPEAAPPPEPAPLPPAPAAEEPPPVAVDAATGEPVPLPLAADAPAPALPDAVTDLADVAATDAGTPAADAAAADAAPVVPPATISAFGSVAAEVAVYTLDYDPTRPGAREFAAARRQIDRQRLSLPPGDNAVESLRAAQKLAPADPALARLADEVIGFYAARAHAALQERRDDDARADHAKAAPLVAEFGRQDGKPWADYRAALLPLLTARLQSAFDAVDAAAVARAKALATALEVPSDQLEPLWSQAIRLPAPGDRLDAGGTAVVLVKLPHDGRPGLAATRSEVTRGEYAAFAAANGRAAARCRNRLAPINLKKRSWDEPGFAQNNSHPVLCVSHDDAQAYAQWFSRRTGQSWRLPTRAEWQQLADFRGAAASCNTGRLACGSEGTVAASQGPATPLGLTGLFGNAREWLGDCARSCNRRIVAGMGWRDNPARATPTQADDFDADTGYDDTGFRLVREVGAAELGIP